MRELLLGLLDLVLPPRCVDCGCETGGSRPLCGRCDAALSRPGPLPAPHPLRALSCGVEYAAASDWIHRFKYPPRGLAGLDPAPGALVQHWAVQAARAAPGPGPELVVPVPLHPRRLRRRGFNPAGLLARAVARERAARFDPVALARVRDTPTQTGLDRRARRRNVRGAFTARSAVPPRVWLVDDVSTTGATLAECARALRAAGAREVVGICAAFTASWPGLRAR